MIDKTFFSVVCPKYPETRDSKGFAFLKFVSPEDAEDAIKSMDGKEMNGNTLTVQEADRSRSSDRRGPPMEYVLSIFAPLIELWTVF